MLRCRISTITVDIHNPQMTLEQLVSEVRAGGEVILVEGENPVVRLSLIDDQPRTPGLFPNSVWMSDDFDDPLTDEFLLGEE